MTHYRIKDLPEQERPRERLETHGPEALSNAELLAIILRTGTAKMTAVELGSSVLAHFGSLARLSGAILAEMTEVDGIGPAKACQIAAAFELGRRAGGRHDSRKPRINGPEDVATLVKSELRDIKQEKFLAVLLNSKNEVMRTVTVTQGTLTASLIHPRETFRTAISEGCNSVVIVHNHPSGDPDPSDEDVKITRKLVEAGKLLGIDVLDHVIIGGNSFTSMKDLGLC